MEDTNDKSFVSHNGDKPFIRTMEDDLKKIKNSPAGNSDRASVISSLGSTPPPFRTNVPIKEMNHSVSAPIPSTPKNLPVDMSLIEKEETKVEANTEKFKPIEKPKAAADSSSPDKWILGRPPSSFGREPANAKTEEKTPPVPRPFPPVSRPVAPVSNNVFSRRPQSLVNLDKETEKLSPQARLARQSSLGLGDSGIGSKERLAASPSSGISSAVSGQSGKTSRGSFNSDLSKLSSFESKKTIEEIIKEDNPIFFLGKFVKLFFVFLVIVGVAAGAYYLYISKRPIVNPVPVVAPGETFIAGAIEATISADLNADLNNEIRIYFSSVRPSGIFRLILKDNNGQNSQGLENFSKSLNITLPDSIASVLEKDYNLIAFNYPEKNYLRLGLVLKVKNPSDVSVSAKNWETDMYKDIKPLFLNTPGVYKEGDQFRSNKYNNFDIRYLPLENENSALNYAFDSEKKFLLLATSKDDIFNLIDKIIEGK
ncbi:MAG: hypothetical protein Q8N37_03595 [bacterium]|nr:hypothetical protein [bacterium]